MTKRALVIGGAGFIGSHLVDGLVQKGCDVTIFDNFETGKSENIQHLSDVVRLLKGDIRDLEALKTALSGMDVVFHLAAQTTVAGSLDNPYLTHEVNNTGTQNVLWAPLQQDVPRVVLSSSCAIYGDVHHPPLKESDFSVPKSPYAASKVFAEALADCFYYSYGLQTVCLRYFNVYGDRQAPDSAYAAVIPRFIDCYRQRRSPIIYGDGRQSRDFIHVSDVVRANLLGASLSEVILEQQRRFNVGSGQCVTLLELLEIIAAQAGFNLSPDFQPARDGDVRKSMADTALAQEKLGFTASVSLGDGIKRLL